MFSRTPHLPHLNRQIQSDMTDAALQIPEYYYAPIHAYADGNLCWDSAMEASQSHETPLSATVAREERYYDCGCHPPLTLEETRPVNIEYFFWSCRCLEGVVAGVLLHAVVLVFNAVHFSVHFFCRGDLICVITPQHVWKPRPKRLIGSGNEDARSFLEVV